MKHRAFKNIFIVLSSFLFLTSCNNLYGKNTCHEDITSFIEPVVPGCFIYEDKTYTKIEKTTEDLSNIGNKFGIIVNRNDYDQVKSNYPDYEYIVMEDNSISFDSDKPLFVCNQKTSIERNVLYLFGELKTYSCYGESYMDYMEVYENL